MDHLGLPTLARALDSLVTQMWRKQYEKKQFAFHSSYGIMQVKLHKRILSCQTCPPGKLKAARTLGQARILAQEPQQAQAVVI
jgi:hypothetical protein